MIDIKNLTVEGMLDALLREAHDNHDARMAARARSVLADHNVELPAANVYDFEREKARRLEGGI